VLRKTGVSRGGGRGIKKWIRQKKSDWMKQISDSAKKIVSFMQDKKGNDSREGTGS